ncbi:MAG: alpha/beta hydrolase [Anaerovorax sp.]
MESLFNFPQTYDTYKGIIIMCHACGRGHDSYMQEIEYFARSGYLIMGYDNTGMNRSDGETLVGISQSPIDLHYAMSYVENTMELKNLPILLYGQSWGGYGVASVGKYAHDVKAIVSVAGFENNSGLIVHKGKQYIGSFMGSLHSFFYPYAQIYEWIIFGKDAGISGIKGFSKTKANVMLIHSKEDDFVSYDESFLKYKKEFKENPRFTFLSLTGHGHNGVLSSDINNNAENGLRRLDETIMKKVVLFYDDAI